MQKRKVLTKLQNKFDMTCSQDWGSVSLSGSDIPNMISRVNNNVNDNTGNAKFHLHIGESKYMNNNPIDIDIYMDNIDEYNIKMNEVFEAYKQAAYDKLNIFQKLYSLVSGEEPFDGSIWYHLDYCTNEVGDINSLYDNVIIDKIGTVDYINSVSNMMVTV